jgi:hypothetical protein
MRNLFLISTAIVIASTGLAFAQGTSPGGSTAAPAPQQSAPPAAPAEKMAPAEKSAPAASKDTPAAAMKTAPADKMAPKSGSMKNDKSKGAAETNTPATDSKPSAADQKAGAAKSPTDTKAGDAKAPAADTKGASAAPPPEKRTEISSAFKQEKVTEVTNVNFNISVGASIPSTVRFYPLPARIVTIYPEWRGYDFILVRGQYIVVRPKTHEVVYIIEN